MTKLNSLITNSKIKKYQLAQKAGISQKHLSAILHGKAEPKVNVAIRIAEALDTTVEQIFSSNKKIGGKGQNKSSLVS